MGQKYGKKGAKRNTIEIQSKQTEQACLRQTGSVK
jgi:hypothetical protein